MIRVLTFLTAHCCLIATSLASEPALEPIQQSLRDGSHSVWFDPDVVDVKPVELDPQRKDTLHRHSRWLANPKSTTSSTSSSSTTGSSNPNPSSLGVFGWLILIVLGVIAAGILIFAFLKIGESVTVDTSSSKSSGMADDLVQQTALRMKELPAELRRENMDLKSEAVRLIECGDLDEAVKCLFGYQLLLLDRQGFLRLSRGKTNNRYVNEVRSRSAEAMELLRSTVDAFEASYFGKHSPSSTLCQRLLESNRMLESIATAQEGVA